MHGGAWILRSEAMLLVFSEGGVDNVVPAPTTTPFRQQASLQHARARRASRREILSHLVSSGRARGGGGGAGAGAGQSGAPTCQRWPGVPHPTPKHTPAQRWCLGVSVRCGDGQRRTRRGAGECRRTAARKSVAAQPAPAPFSGLRASRLCRPPRAREKGVERGNARFGRDPGFRSNRRLEESTRVFFLSDTLPPGWLHAGGQLV